MKKQCFQFLIKNLIKILLLSIIISAFDMAVNSGIIENLTALGQMQQSNAAFLLWEVFRSSKNYVYTICGIGTACILVSISVDTYKFVKNHFITNEQEHEK